ncbi:hypothetical protein ACGF0K_31845 [Streptomyces sp. NPDC048156]|uniref:hypothetical protein n=1 Tax=Streptomyces sp. NPDC048156 TaxID=3365502 RepID=UPI003719D991
MQVLPRQQMAQQASKERIEAAEAMSAAQREAEKVRLVVSSDGGSLTVQVTNHALRVVTDVEPLDVTPTDAGPWRSWKPNPNVGRQLSSLSRPPLHPGERMTVAVWLLDDNGDQLRELPRKATVEVRFCDDDGQWWPSVTGVGTQRIPPPLRRGRARHNDPSVTRPV